MVTNEERREVAKKLRRTARGTRGKKDKKEAR